MKDDFRDGPWSLNGKEANKNLLARKRVVGPRFQCVEGVKEVLELR